MKDIVDVIIFSRTPWNRTSPPLVSGLDLAATEWHKRASCKGMPLDEFYGTGNRRRSVKDICRNCPVRIECLEDALDHYYPDGIWGGLSGHERRMLRAGTPTRWTRVLLSKEMIEKWKKKGQEEAAEQEEAA